MLALGRLLKARREAEGQEMLERCVAVLEARLDAHTINEAECRNLAAAATEVGKTKTAEKAKARLNTIREKGVFDEENLAASTNVASMVKGN